MSFILTDDESLYSDENDLLDSILCQEQEEISILEMSCNSYDEKSDVENESDSDFDSSIEPDSSCYASSFDDSSSFNQPTPTDTKNHRRFQDENWDRNKTPISSVSFSHKSLLQRGRKPRPKTVNPRKLLPKVFDMNVRHSPIARDALQFNKKFAKNSQLKTVEDDVTIVSEPKIIQNKDFLKAHSQLSNIPSRESFSDEFDSKIHNHEHSLTTTPFVSKYFNNKPSRTINPIPKTFDQLQVEPKILFVPRLKIHKNTQHIIYIRTPLPSETVSLKLSLSKTSSKCRIAKYMIIPSTLPLRYLDTSGKPLDNLLQNLIVPASSNSVELQPKSVLAVFIEFFQIDSNVTIRECLSVSTFGSTFFIPIVAYSGISDIVVADTENNNNTLASKYYLRKSCLLPQQNPNQNSSLNAFEIVVPLQFQNNGTRESFCYISAALFNKNAIQNGNSNILVGGFSLDKISMVDSISDSFAFLLGSKNRNSLQSYSQSYTTVYMTVFVSAIGNSTPPLDIQLLILSTEEHLRQRIKSGNSEKLKEYSILLQDLDNEARLDIKVNPAFDGGDLKKVGENYFADIEAEHLTQTFANYVSRQNLNVVIDL